jgi:hypothetical protein
MSQTDYIDLVTEIRAAVERSGIPVTGSLTGGFEVTKRVAWALRHEGAGLLMKAGGENIVEWAGVSFSASRVCYPDGHLYKVLTDVPTTNGAQWLDNGFVDPSLYLPALDPGEETSPPPPPLDVDAIIVELDLMRKDLRELRGLLVEGQRAFADASSALRDTLRHVVLTGREDPVTGLITLTPGAR